MNSLPFSKSNNPLKEILNGVYGSFYTEESYQMFYVMCSIPMKRIGMLETASEAFDIKNVSFDELIQRDIDAVRVRAITHDYLEKSKGKAIFFPPLLVSLMEYEKGCVVDGYSESEEKICDDWYEKTWGSSKFQIRLPISPDEQDIAIDFKGKKLPVYNYGCELKFNPDAMKLVVLDGQHRLCALKHLSEDSSKAQYVENINIPICIVVSPDAQEGGVQKVTSNLRQLFVTINSKGKEVSGHFLTLLKEKSLSALTVREFAESWKADESRNFSMLHMIEWNQREKGKSNQINCPYSITTISIIADVLEKYLFKGNTYNFLNLSTAIELEAGDEFTAPQDIAEDDFSPEQEAVLRGRVKDYIIPALTVLFKDPSPYKEVINSFEKANKWLDKEVSNKRDGSATFRNEVLRNFRKTNKLNLHSVRDFEKEFEDQISINSSYAPYFLNVFHQALIRTWISVSEKLMIHECSPVNVAKALVPALEVIVFNLQKELFSSTRAYAQYVLYKGETVIVTKRAKDQWLNLILSSFLNKDVMNIFISAIDSSQIDIKKVEKEVYSLAKSSYASYLCVYRKAVRADIEKNWRDRGFDELLVNKLINAYNELTKDANSEDFEKIIHERVVESEKKAKMAISNVLELS